MLNKINFKSLYSSGESDSPISFFTDALSNSISFDFGLGFFSSASFNVLSIGFAKFISNGGKMRLYINQYLSEEDYEIFTSHPDIVENKVIDSFTSMLNVLTKRDKQFFNCLSYLIYTNRIEVKIVIPNSGGIAHQKFGIFTDAAKNKVSFIGSLNLTASALLSKNIESISCNSSWKGAAETINDYQQLFDKYFSGDKEGITVIPANRLTKEIIKAFPATEEKTLLDNEKELIEELTHPKVLGNNLSEECRKDEPHFPYPTGAFDYQKEAYKNWKNNGYTGIFAMATGTGKTIYILDEPTTGLHFADVHKLVDILHKLAEGGNTVVVIEHNLDVIKTADYIIDMGPEGGDRGGTVIAKGTPEEVAKVKKSYTGQYVKKYLEEK